MSDLEKMRPHLRGKAKTSLPQLQMDLKCSYPEAKSFLKQLQEACWADTQVDGIFYRLNAKLIDQRELTQQECRSFAERLTARQIRALEVVDIRSNGLAGAQRGRYRDAFEALRFYGLVHMFGDSYHRSVTEASVQRIKDLQIPETEDLLLACVSSPILINAAAQDADPEELLDLPFVPQACSSFVRHGLLTFRLTGEQPRPVRFNGKVNTRKLSFELVEAMMLHRDLPTKADYEREARECLCRIEVSNLCSDEFKEAARLAVEQICQELTYSNLREIRSILLSHSTVDDLDDDLNDGEDD